MTEHQIEVQILGYLKRRAIFAWKVKTVGTYDPKLGRFRKSSPWYRKGVADIIGIFEGKPLALEVKTAVGRPSEFQRMFLKEFAENGGICGIVRSIQDVERLLDAATKQKRQEFIDAR